MWSNNILNYLEAADEFQPPSWPRRITFCITHDLECFHVLFFFFFCYRYSFMALKQVLNLDVFERDD